VNRKRRPMIPCKGRPATAPTIQHIKALARELTDVWLTNCTHYQRVCTSAASRQLIELNMVRYLGQHQEALRVHCGHLKNNLSRFWSEVLDKYWTVASWATHAHHPY
jgi:hypothetical protein